MTVTYEGDALEIGFNAAYMLEMLKYIPTDEVRMTFKAPSARRPASRWAGMIRRATWRW